MTGATMAFGRFVTKELALSKAEMSNFLLMTKIIYSLMVYFPLSIGRVIPKIAFVIVFVKRKATITLASKKAICTADRFNPLIIPTPSPMRSASTKIPTLDQIIVFTILSPYFYF